MRPCLRWLASFLVPILAVQCHAQGRIDCNALQSRVLGQTVHYCVILPPGYDAATAGHSPRRYPVLYFLHGLGDNEQTLFKGGGWDLIEDLRQKGQISDFLVIAPEGKRSFFINSADGRVSYGDFFIREFIPYIESHYSIRRERSARAISGVSMGGYGALRFALAYPELFSSVSAQSAALIAQSPRQTETMPMLTPLSGLLGAVFGNPVDLRHWSQNSPFVLAKQNRALIRSTKLSIYFNCGREDEFGFENGAAELHRQLQAEGIEHEYHLYPGNHDAGYFLAHLGETLTFHSRVFAAGKQFLSGPTEERRPRN
ncbi:MAG TPA: alpha/beta hydrolase family protein [Terriglobales bacterium]|jgi:S-formylglutathione hydrolase FrmB|nr:alpha/beta hydrolase family protein [Terriglobales bacterium]